MLKSQGIFIVLEGSDGSGKATQFELLRKRLQSKGYQVEVFDFPRYDKPSSHFVTKYLNGEYGPASSISPYTASLFFALDRYEAGIEIRKALNEGKVVLSNRYVGSNMAHQGSKFNEDIEKRSFFVWEDSLEFQLLNIPRPNINIFLRVPAKISYELIKQKAARNYTPKSHDEHEADIGHLGKAVETYDLLCNLFPKDYVAIDCVEGGRLLDIESINAKIWALVQNYLPQIEIEDLKNDIDSVSANDAHTEVVQDNISSNREYIKWEIKELSLSSISEFVKAGIPINIDQSSKWGTTKSTSGYFIPSSLSDAQKNSYTSHYNSFLKKYTEFSDKLLQELTNKNKKTASQVHREIMQRCLPTAALLKARVSVSRDNIARILNFIRHSGSEELAKLEKSLTEKIRVAWPKWNVNEITSGSSNSPEQLNQLIEQLSIDKLPQIFSAEHSTKLVEVHPRNEFDLLADSVYSFSELTRDQILAAMDSWTYTHKTKVFENALRIRESLLEIPQYKIDSTSDQITITELMNQVGSHKFQLQIPTIRYGYDMPELIENSSLEDGYLDLFDSFVTLYKDMQQTKDYSLLKYCILASYKLRWQANLSALDLKISYKASQSLYLKSLTAHLIDVVAQNHPLLAGQLKTADIQARSNINSKEKAKPRNRRRRS